MRNVSHPRTLRAAGGQRSSWKGLSLPLFQKRVPYAIIRALEGVVYHCHQVPQPNTHPAGVNPSFPVQRSPWPFLSPLGSVPERHPIMTGSPSPLL